MNRKKGILCLSLAAMMLLLGAGQFASGCPVGEVTYYVGPTALGNGSGSNWNNRADYLDMDFWADIQNELNDNSVNILLADSTYNRGMLMLQDKGNLKHRLYVCANTRYAPLFTGGGTCYIYLQGCNNIEFHGITFSGAATSFAVTSEYYGNTSIRDIQFHYCKFQDLPNVTYGGIGLGNAYNTNIRRCYFENVGNDGSAHHIYANKQCAGITITQCDFLDCAGAYVKLRNDVDYCTVDDCYFYSSDSQYNREFICMSLSNDVNPGDEYFGTNFQFTNNDFEYAESGGYVRIATAFRCAGYTSPDYDYTLDEDEADTLNSGITRDKRNLLSSDMGIDYSKIKIYNNTYTLVEYPFTYGWFARYGEEVEEGEYEGYTTVGTSVPSASGTRASPPKLRNGDFDWKGDRQRCWKAFSGSAPPTNCAGLGDTKGVMLVKAESTQRFGQWFSVPASVTSLEVDFALGNKINSGLGADGIRFKVELYHSEIGDDYLAFAVANDGRLGYMTNNSTFKFDPNLGAVEFKSDFSKIYHLGIVTHYDHSTPHYNIYLGEGVHGAYTIYEYDLTEAVGDDPVQDDVVGLLMFSSYNADVRIDNVH